MTVQYDGTGYNGWQAQPAGITVQGMLQTKIHEIAGESTTVIGAGRTDAGVHALAQVASFRTGSKLAADTFKRALNAVLPEAIRILDAGEAEETFHPRYDAKSKIYFYVIAAGPVVSPFLWRYAWRVPHRLDLDAMEQALGALEGPHDFSAFRGSGCGAKTTVRTVSRLSVERLEGLGFMGARLGGSFLKISAEADAFLRHMVRNIVGTAVEAGKGKISPADIAGILESRDRRCAGPTAPARGLFLEKVNY